jgi:triacylglycerol lipase
MNLKPEYDPQNALNLAQASADAYRLGATGIWDSGTDTHVVVSQRQDCLIVAFRGTADLRNWLTDLDCERVDLGDGIEAHRGFSEALQSVWQKLWPMLNTKLPIVFTGHSLGGALAMLAADRCGAENNLLYTFGQPRVGNKAFCAEFDRRWAGRAFRVVHAQDIVTRVPWLLNAYRHAGTEVFFDALNVPHFDLPWWKKVPSDVFGTWAEYRAAGRIAQIADHSVDRYIEILGSQSLVTSAATT